MEECKGLIYRGYNQVYKTSRGFEHKQGFNLLKRKSCSGCSNCGGLLDYANEALCDYTFYLHKNPIGDGDLYRLTYDGDEFHFTEITGVKKY